MKRRAFLAALGAGAIVGPGWLRRAFGDASFAGEAAAPAAPGSALGPTLRAARLAERPVLALVVPDDEAARPARGRLFGSWLMGGDNDAFVRLAPFELVCATEAELRAAGVKDAAGALFVRFEPDGAREAVAGEGAPVEYPRDERAAAAQAGWVDARARKATGLSEATRRRMADAAEARLTPGERASLGSPSKVGDDLALRAAPALYERALRDDHWARTVGGAVARRLRGERVPGSYWATATPCGLDHVDGLVEKDVVLMKCGMGHVPERARRFLYLYAEGPIARYRKGR